VTVQKAIINTEQQIENGKFPNKTSNAQAFTENMGIDGTNTHSRTSLLGKQSAYHQPNVAGCWIARVKHSIYKTVLYTPVLK